MTSRTPKPEEVWSESDLRAFLSLGPGSLSPLGESDDHGSGGRDHNPRIFGEWFAITRSAARVLAVLFEAGTRPLTRKEIGEQTGMCRETVHLALVRLRDALEPGELVSDGRLYTLTEAGCADCLDALNDAARRELAA